MKDIFYDLKFVNTGINVLSSQGALNMYMEKVLLLRDE